MAWSSAARPSRSASSSTARLELQKGWGWGWGGGSSAVSGPGSLAAPTVVKCREKGDQLAERRRRAILPKQAWTVSKRAGRYAALFHNQSARSA